MIWVWFAGAAALLLFVLVWALFLNRPNSDGSDAESFETLLSETVSFYRQVSVTANAGFRNGVGVSILRFSQIRENASVLGAKPDEPSPAADETGSNGGPASERDEEEPSKADETKSDE